MNRVPLRIVEAILLEIPNSSIHKDFSTENKTVFKIGLNVIVIPTKGITSDHLHDILLDQLDMHWWHIDYIFGQNGIKL